MVSNLSLFPLIALSHTIHRHIDGNVCDYQFALQKKNTLTNTIRSIFSGLDFCTAPDSQLEFDTKMVEWLHYFSALGLIFTRVFFMRMRMSHVGAALS